MRPVGRGALTKLVRKAADVEGVADNRVRTWVGASALFQVMSGAVRDRALPRYLVKGGFALELRFLNRARTSQDIDIVLPVQQDAIVEALARAIDGREWDGFSFKLKERSKEREYVWQVGIQVLYAGGPWCSLTAELASGSADEPEIVEAYDLRPFGLSEAEPVPCLSRFEQIAQKLHAASSASSGMRYRDLVDIFLLDELLERDDARLLAVVERTFERREEHAWPIRSFYNRRWIAPLNDLLRQLDLQMTAHDLFRAVNQLVLRLLGVPMNPNYEYVFMVLHANDQAPHNILQNALREGEGLKVFRRMTEEEGYRLAHIFPFPGSATERAVLTVLEREKQEQA